MDITLVNCPPWAVKTPPLHIGYLTAYLREKGHEVLPVDLNIESYSKANPDQKYIWEQDLKTKWIWDHTSFINKEIDSWVERILDLDTPIIGISVYFDSKGICAELARRIKERDPSKVIIFGGPQCYRGFLTEWLFDHGFQNEKFVDVFVIGEGEETLHEILSRYERKGKIDYCKGTIIRKDDELIDCGDRPPINDLDKIPMPDLGDLPLEKYTKKNEIPILGSRGCFGRCAFCQDFSNVGQYRSRSAENIFKEMCWWFDSGYNEFSFNDLVSNGDLKQLSKLCDLIIKSKLHNQITIASKMRCRGDMTAELCKRLYEAGWRYILFGVESGSQTILNKMKKGYTVSEIEKNLRDTCNAGIGPEICIIVGFPGETHETFTETLNFLGRNHRYIDKIAVLYPVSLRIGSPIAKRYKEYGILRDEEYWQTSDGRNTYAWRLQLVYGVIKLANSLGIKLGFDETHFYFYRALEYYHTFIKDYDRSYEIMIDALQYLSTKLKESKYSNRLT